MKSINLKRLILPNFPYLLFVFLFDKAAQAARLAPGADLSDKLLSIGDGFAAAFSSFAPSFHPIDLLVGVMGAVLIHLIVYAILRGMGLSVALVPLDNGGDLSALFSG